MEALKYILFFGAIFIGIMIKFIYDKKQRKVKLLERIRNEWGKRPVREYSYDEYQIISHYFKNRGEEGFVIDDITWNDLDMDTIFMLINHTHSSVGQDYLYYLLRKPEFDPDVLKERNRLIEFFMGHAQEREKLQMIFSEMGRTTHIAITDYIYKLHNLKSGGNAKHITSNLLIVFSFLFLFIVPSLGILMVIASLGFSLYQYFSHKGSMEPYILSFQIIMRMLVGADDFEKISIPEIEEYSKQIIKAKNIFKKFRKGSFWVTSGKGMGGGFEEAILDYVRMIFHVDLIKFNNMVHEVQNNISTIEVLMENMGILESAIAIASFRTMLEEEYCIPELSRDKNAFLIAENMYHPMIDEPVKNSIDVQHGAIITGSNASGKSTFLKTTAINALLAQTIYTCMADRYQTTFYKIYSSMALQDDLLSQESYYIVEIKSLKRILDNIDENTCILCFVDEVLRGTNTIERIAASSQILKSLVKDNVVCFAATHDIELTHLLEKDYNNYHFQEEVQDNDILFNYKLFEGRATSRNAIKLLSIIGYDDNIIRSAENTAAGFAENGVWEL